MGEIQPRPYEGLTPEVWEDAGKEFWGHRGWEFQRRGLWIRVNVKSGVRRDKGRLYVL